MNRFAIVGEEGVSLLTSNCASYGINMAFINSELSFREFTETFYSERNKLDALKTRGAYLAEENERLREENKLLKKENIEYEKEEVWLRNKYNEMSLKKSDLDKECFGLQSGLNDARFGITIAETRELRLLNTIKNLESDITYLKLSWEREGMEG